MRTKNSKKPASKISPEEKLRAKLKESHRKFLKEDEDDLGAEEDLGSDEDFGGGEDLEGGADLGGGGEDFDLGDDEGLGDESIDSFEDDELTPDQSDWEDEQVDSLLEPAEDELLDIEGNSDALGAEDDFDITGEGDDFDFDGDSDDLLDEAEGDDFDLDIESDGDDLSDVADVDAGLDNSVYGAEELGDIIDSPNTLNTLKSSLDSQAQEQVPAEGGDGDFDLDTELEESLIAEAELEDEILHEMKKINEAEVASTVTKIDWEKEPDSELEGDFAKVKKPSEGPDEGAQEHDKEGPSDTMKQEIKESQKKSRMLVKLAKQVIALKNKAKELQMENYRLLKANGLLAAAGEVLDAKSRTKIVESFRRCKTTEQVNALYKKITNVIKEKSRGSLNEAVNKSKGGVRNYSAAKEEEMSQEQLRANLLMGIKGSDDAYFSRY